jgi:hypothetical protein
MTLKIHELIEELNAEFNFDTIFSHDSVLTTDLKEGVFLFAPDNKIPAKSWAEKAFQEWRRWKRQILLIIPYRPNYKWFRLLTSVPNMQLRIIDEKIDYSKSTVRRPLNIASCIIILPKREEVDENKLLMQFN